jgi:isoamylase
MLNAYWEDLEFELPVIGSEQKDGGHRWIDTFLESPDDICDLPKAPEVQGATYSVRRHSIVVLLARI